jgi:glucose/arabinose dehydrogenase
VSSFRTLVARLRVGFICLLVADGVALAPRAYAQRLEPGEPEQLFQMTGWVPGVPSAMDLAVLPDGRTVIVQQPGDVTIRAKDGTVIRNVARFPIKPLTKTEQGLLGVVAHPDFAQNQTLYFYASIGESIADKDQVLKATLSPDNKLTIDYANPLLKLESPEKHNGSVMIIHRGLLYIGVGDSGGDATPPANKYASCLNKPKGKILRVGLDGSIPADNPLVDLAMVTGCTTETRTTGGFSMQPPDKRIYAWGMRNPYRFWIDPTTDLLWIADVGEKVREEISIGGKGTHFGYPFEEGSVPYGGLAYDTFGGCKGMVPSTACTRPGFEYPNKQGDDSCVIGGFILDHCAWPAAYRNRYLFGDFVSGRIWTMEVTPDRRGLLPNTRRQLATFRTLNGFRMGPDGAVYVMAFDATAIYRITPRERPADCRDGSPAAPDAAASNGAPMDAGAAAGGSGGGGSGGAGRGGGSGAAGTGPGGAGQTTGGGDTGGGGGRSAGSAGSGGTGGARPRGEEAPRAPGKSGGCSVGGANTDGGVAFPWIGLSALALGARRFARRRPGERLRGFGVALAFVIAAALGQAGCASPEGARGNARAGGKSGSGGTRGSANGGAPVNSGGRSGSSHPGGAGGAESASADASGGDTSPGDAGGCSDPAFVCDPAAPLPTSIKATGFFPAAPDLSPTLAALRPYQPSPELWSDGLHKQRHILLPHGRTIDNGDAAAWSFPVGTVFVKTFLDDGPAGKPRPIETRIIRRTADPFAEFEFAVYRWNAEGSDASLLSITGTTRTPVSVTVAGKTFTHNIPSENDCGDCHKAQAKVAGSAIIGFDELRLAGPRRDATQSQLSELGAAGLFAQSVPQKPRVIQDSDPVLAKVKTFVFGNCVHCHHAKSSQVDLNPEVFVANTVGQKVDASGIQAPPGWFRVTPGMPEKSVLYVQAERLIAALPMGMKPMPPIGVTIPDPDGVSAIAGWIRALR